MALLVVAALLAGCGGPKPAHDASELVPPSVVSFVAVKTNLGSLPRLLNRFPFGPKAVKALRHGLELKASMGPALDLAVFKGGTVFFTQPVDEKRFVAALRADEVHAQIRGWTVFTNRPALLDLVKHHKETLAALPAYKHAAGLLPADAVARAYVAPGAARQVLNGAGGIVNGAQLGRSTQLGLGVDKTSWAAVALSASGDRLKLEVHTPGAGGPDAQSTSDLVSQIPSGSVVAVGLGGVGRFPGGLKVGGVDLQGIADALGGEAVAYLRAGLPFPEVTIASKPKDPQKAVLDVGRLIAKLAKPKAPPVPTTVDGVTLLDVALGAVDIYYGTFDGTLVVTDSTTSVSALRSSGDKLKVPGLPDKTTGFLYIDVEHALPALKAFAKLANQTVPAQVDAYLRPVETIVLYGTRDRDVQNIFAILQTR